MFDGHNGVRAAEHATNRLQQLLAQEPALRVCTGDGPPASDAHEEEQLATAFKRAFHTVDTEILKVAKEEGTIVLCFSCTTDWDVMTDLCVYLRHHNNLPQRRGMVQQPSSSCASAACCMRPTLATHVRS